MNLLSTIWFTVTCFIAGINGPLHAQNDFKPCYEEKAYRIMVPEYYMVGTHYQGGRRALQRYFKTQYEYKKAYQNETGFLTLRFMVNCKGETGKYEVLGASSNLKEKNFSPGLVQEFVELTQQLTDWIPGESQGTKLDSFIYITFRLKEGKLLEISP